VEAQTAAPDGPAPFRIVIPRTAREVQAIRRQRSELSSQLTSVRERRTTLANQYEQASGANRAGLEKQLEVLDQRIVQLESEIEQTGQVLRSTDASLLATSATEPSGPLNQGQFTAISIVFTLFVLARWRWPPRASSGAGRRAPSRRRDGARPPSDSTGWSRRWTRSRSRWSACPRGSAS
jgi:hypothetical protein